MNKDIQNEDIELDLTETNELLFNVQIDGLRENVKLCPRLLIKTPNVSYTFEGSNERGNVSFIIPEGILTEGTYTSSLEVIVGNKLLVPLKFNTTFKNGLKTSSALIEASAQIQDIKCKATQVIKESNISPLKKRWIEKVNKNR